MICPADETIAGFVDGGLDAAQTAALREHLEECSRCRGRVARVTADAAPPTRKADPFRIGSVLVGKYRVVSVLGAGGMGAVVSAVHEELGQKVAIKVLHEAALNDGDSVKRFLREGRAAARLRSDHAVRIYDVDRLPDGAPFLVMEHLEGRDLSSLQRERALEIDEAVGYVLQAIEAIKEAHAQNLIHRDIKPANLFLAKLPNGETRVKVLDFGLAKEIGLHKGVGSDLTTEHAFLGSPMFMSPEQVRDPRTVDKRTDVWSLGTTLWQLITGQAPFSRSSVQATLAEVCTKKLPPASSVRPGVPQYIDEVIARCMHKDPEGRFASVEALAAALRDPQRRPSDRSTASMDTGISSPDTPRIPDTEPEKKAFRRTEPMPARPLPVALPPLAGMTPRSAPTFVRPHPPADPPRKSGPPVALAIVAALALLAIAALGAVQFLPRATSESTTTSPTVTSSTATLAAAPASPAAPSSTAGSLPPEPATATATATTSATASATASATVVAKPPAVPKPPTTARRPPPAASTGRPADKDPYDR